MEANDSGADVGSVGYQPVGGTDGDAVVNCRDGHADADEDTVAMSVDCRDNHCAVRTVDIPLRSVVVVVVVVVLASESLPLSIVVV